MVNVASKESKKALIWHDTVVLKGNTTVHKDNAVYFWLNATKS